jgi:hypothetical protein
MGTWRCEKCGYWSAGASPSQFSDDAKNVCHTCIDKSTGRKRYRTIIDTEVYPEGSPYTETSRTRMIEDALRRITRKCGAAPAAPSGARRPST